MYCILLRGRSIVIDCIDDKTRVLRKLYNRNIPYYKQVINNNISIKKILKESIQ